MPCSQGKSRLSEFQLSEFLRVSCIFPELQVHPNRITKDCVLEVAPSPVTGNDYYFCGPPSFLGHIRQVPDFTVYRTNFHPQVSDKVPSSRFEHFFIL
jgi:hypothetical protein